MGELIVGVLLGPAVLGLIEPGEAIQLLAEIGIFFLMFHAGIETQPLEFYDALKRSLGVAVVGAIVPFGVSFSLAMLYGLDLVGATFVGLTMTATAVVITLTSLKDLGLAGATTAFTPNHVLAAAVAVRASARIGPRITGVQPLAHLLEVAEIRIHDECPLAGINVSSGAQIVGQWVNDALELPPAPDEPFRSGTILVAAGSPDSIKRLSEIAPPITQEGTIVVAGFGDVGRKVVEMLLDAGETVCVIDATGQPAWLFWPARAIVPHYWSPPWYGIMRRMSPLSPAPPWRTTSGEFSRRVRTSLCQ